MISNRPAYSANLKQNAQPARSRQLSRSHCLPERLNHGFAVLPLSGVPRVLACDSHQPCMASGAAMHVNVGQGLDDLLDRLNGFNTDQFLIEA